MRRAELCNAVALFAATVMGRSGELGFVYVLMATAALRLGNPKHGVLASGHMARFAFHLDMPALQWITARGVFFHSKRRRLESIHRVTNCAISAAGACHELAVVVVGMAIGALRKSDRRLEIALGVTFAAAHAAVLSEQGKHGFRMVEAFELCHLRPLCGVVARLAGALEATLVRISVTVRATRERNPRVFDVRFGIRHGRVTFSAGHRCVGSRQGEFRGRMIECCGELPRIRSVALHTVRTQLPAVLVLMAPDAGTGESQIAMIQVFHLNLRARRGHDLSRVVALLATQSGMAARQRESGLPMIHGFAVRLPADERKICAIVVRVTLNAIFARSARAHPNRVHTAILRKPIPDFRVAIQAFEFHSPA